MKAVKHLLRYVRGTIEYGIQYNKGGRKVLKGYSDRSYNMDVDDGKRTTGTVFYFCDSPIAWNTQKQSTVALSSCEVEFMAVASAACQALWLQGLLEDLTSWKQEKVTLFLDNMSAITLMKNPVFQGRSKHIRTKYHFIRECVEKQKIEVDHNSGE
ncbi:secreted RxLR effector protein 161-like [Bidens hawaiensis]|uniref:secreted RxLR effector protein 161-like n=1 Tax=Bidens hawaiensis TaxID=980011 RepID=UPI00404B488A